jgi:Zn-dependent protease with chaperone function
MLNGAVMGLLGRLRYVLLTDALLERLPEDQVEAVMAHEVGHVRRKHVPWLAGGLLASIGVPMAAVDLWVRFSGRGHVTTAQEVALQLGLVGVSLLAGLMLFGWISRRFEWQADAFSAQHLSGHRTDQQGDARPVVISATAVGSMAGALEAVASLNHMPRRKFSWRHGSIQRRIDNLRDLVGRPARGLRIDRTVGWIKLATAVGLAGLIAVTVWWG